MKNISYKNRGMYLENLINDTNTYYLAKDKAVIYKKPTPIKVLDVSYNTRETTIINKAVFSNISTLDYNGLYNGRYIEFDAKECHNSTSFPLSNIKYHQIEHIKKIIRHKGIVFLIISMNCSFYLLPGENLISFINNNTRKSIPFNELKKISYKIKDTYIPKIDYLTTIDDIYFKEENL